MIHRNVPANVSFNVRPFFFPEKRGVFDLLFPATVSKTPSKALLRTQQESHSRKLTDTLRVTWTATPENLQVTPQNLLVTLRKLTVARPKITCHTPEVTGSSFLPLLPKQQRSHARPVEENTTSRGIKPHGKSVAESDDSGSAIPTFWSRSRTNTRHAKTAVVFFNSGFFVQVGFSCVVFPVFLVCAPFATASFRSALQFYCVSQSVEHHHGQLMFLELNQIHSGTQLHS